MQNYSLTQKIFHNFVLSNKFIKKSFYEIEKLLYLKKDIDLLKETHIFVTSLPRSGTTVLLNFLYDSGEFKSLTYRNMPLVLAPNLSNIINNKKNINKTERFHQDGVMFDLESPEAFDEVFFSLFNKDELKDELKNYLNLILLKSKRRRYLSKNNLNYKRIDVILSILPNSYFIIPFREPLQHANSLLKQHKNFSLLQKKNKFLRKYMNYLGHNEFGLDHISWNEPKKFNNFEDLDYWLEQWYLFYQDLYEKHKKNKNCIFLKYENLGNHEEINLLKNKLKIFKNYPVNFKISPKNIEKKFDKNLFDSAKKLYNSI